MEWLVILIGAVAWFIHRGSVNSRITALEATVAQLRLDIAARKSIRSTAEREAPAAGPAPFFERPAVTSPAPQPRRPEAQTLQATLDEIREEANERVPPVPESADQRVPSSAPPDKEEPPELPIVGWVRSYFTGGNVIVRVGILVLFFGVAFLLKYAAEHSHVPIEVRLMGVAALAVVLLGVGWRLRERRPGYALALQGGGVGVLYLTVFAALHLYALIPAAGAFGLLAGIGVFSGALAVRQDSMALAMLGAAGGFLAPVLAATEHGNHVMLFSYYVLLDLAVIGIAWSKAWRPLNLVAFVFTFGISAVWGATQYRPELLGTTEPFLIVFFLMFTAIAVLFAFRRAPNLLYYVDGTLVFGTPAVVMALQSGLVHHIPYAMAYSALGLGAFYLLLAWVLFARHRDSLRLLVEACLALSVAFLTLAIPLALQGRWTAACWALEGAAVLWVGLRQQRRLAIAAGVLLQLAAGIAYIGHEPMVSGTRAIANSHFVAAVLISVGGLVAAALTRRASAELKELRLPVTTTLFYWGLAWWLFAGLTDIDRFVPDTYQLAAALTFVALSTACLSLLAEILDWSTARVPPLSLFPLMAIAAYLWVPHRHPSAFGGWWVWPTAAVVAYAALKRQESAVTPAWQGLLHVLALWLVAGLVTWECAWQVHEAVGGAWAVATWGVIPAAVLYTLPHVARRQAWPIAAHLDSYLCDAATGLALYLCIWCLATNVISNGDPAPLRYVPLLNPLDAAGGFALLATIAWLIRLPSFGVTSWLTVDRRPFFGVAAATTFCWLNTVLLRTLHHWEHVPYNFDAMMASTLTQSSLSLFWTVMALAAMLWSARRGYRLPWFCGAALMVVVLVKLFLVDLSHIGTIPRIVSFLGVGALMLVLGYFSPLPPSRPETES
jgi:uncharacterized membrane protein